MRLPAPMLARSFLAPLLLAALAACAHETEASAAPASLPPALPPPELVVATTDPAAPTPDTAAGPVACSDPRPQACTTEYRPVCATRDTGVRCVTTPCPSSERRTYSNACSACADAKVYDHVAGECPAAVNPDG